MHNNRNGIIFVERTHEEDQVTNMDNMKRSNYNFEEDAVIDTVELRREKKKFIMRRPTTNNNTANYNIATNDNANQILLKEVHNIIYPPELDSTDFSFTRQNRKSKVMSSHFRNSMFVLRNVILLRPQKVNDNQKQEEGSISIESDTMMKAKPKKAVEQSGESWMFTGSFFALRILFVDLLIAWCDVASDFVQGYALMITPGKFYYGVITLSINWIPGIVAAIHLLSVYRRELAWYNAILYAILLILFCD